MAIYAAGFSMKLLAPSATTPAEAKVLAHGREGVRKARTATGLAKIAILDQLLGRADRHLANVE